MHKIVLIRHGQSVWNKEPRRFTGWTDVEMTEKGIEEAHGAGKILKEKGYVFDLAYSSLLMRANETLDIVLGEMGIKNIPIVYNWRLNERHYGALQGLTHNEMIEKYGEEQVRIWRRSYKTKPPLLTKDDPRYSGKDEKYKDLKPEEIPLGESLEDTVKRVLPFWNGDIAPKVKEGRNIIVSASGNSIRALVKMLDQVSDEDIMNVEIQTGNPLVYELDDDLKPIRHYYLKEK